MEDYILDRIKECGSFSKEQIKFLTDNIEVVKNVFLLGAMEN